jgi:predicted flap endonuclease-1-like 5' DNA nuclease
LRLINAISTADADALNRAGITSFQQIAAWTRRDLDHLPDSLGGRRRIARENWIEQAALLAKGTPTAHIRRLKARADAAAAAQRPAPPEPETLRRTGPPQGPQARPEASAPTPPPTPRPAARPVQAQPAAAPPAATAQPQPPRPQQVGPQPILATRATGVPSTGPRADRPAASPATPAQRPTPATPARPGDRSEDLTRIDGIDANVAKTLNAHGITRIDQIAHWSDDVQRRVDRLFGDEDRVRREDWVGQARRLAGLETPNAGPQASSGAGAAAAAAASAVAGISATARPRPSPPAEEDGAGKSSQASQPPQPSQSAQPATPEPASIPAPPPRPAAPSQASQPSPSAVSPEAPKTAQPAAAPSPPTSSSGGSVERLRSVRSAALVGRDASDMRGSDDLKRIRGIGVLIEKRLKMMGYTRYAEIAEWSQADIDRVNEQLDFGGRIERENWIQQARILSNGGQTEFSRRQDRNSD